MGIVQAILMAVSLCADCFAVSICSSVTLKHIRWASVFRVAIAFAVIQSGLLAVGWAFGHLFVGLVDKISHIIGFLLLLYVGGSMLIEGIKALRTGYCETRDLNGWRNIILGGIATSIDALAVGVSQSMAKVQWDGFMPLLLAVFAVTAISVIAGIFGGKAIGSRLGHWAEVSGGLILIGIGVSILL